MSLCVTYLKGILLNIITRNYERLLIFKYYRINTKQRNWKHLISEGEMSVSYDIPWRSSIRFSVFASKCVLLIIVFLQEPIVHLSRKVCILLFVISVIAITYFHFPLFTC